jgi:hypothetical protein
MWAHHLQILCLHALFSAYILASGLESILKQIKKNKATLTIKSNLPFIMPISILLILGVASTTGVSTSLTPEMSLKRWIKPNWTIPSEIRILDEIDFGPDGDYSFSRIGSNDDGGFGAFLPQKWEFKCSRIFFSGIESTKTIDSFIDCLSRQVNLIIVSPQFYNLSSRKGTYPYFLNSVNDTLDEYFQCKHWRSKSQYLFCVKNRT